MGMLSATKCLGMFVLFGCLSAVRAEIVADYQADFSTENPKAGWAYKWNPTGVDIGNSAGYADLVPDGKWRYVVDPKHPPSSGNKLPNAKWLQLGKKKWGPGSCVVKSTDQRIHYVIAAYTVQAGEAGIGYIENSYVKRHKEDGSSEVRIYVNDELVGSTIVVQTEGMLFDVCLGRLKAGDTVYVAYGPGEMQSFSAELIYQINISK